jgi:Leucine-rich repeat (LRR) protein
MINSVSNKMSQQANLIRHYIGRLVVMITITLATVFVAEAATDCNAVTEISTIECESLLELYNSIDIANWTDNGGWGVTNTPCSWKGIICDNNGVTEIFLHSLIGPIPNFSGLPHLESLSLGSSQNNDNPVVTGPIPDFSALPNLKGLSLSNHQITGSIPDFSALPNLERLTIGNYTPTGNNQLTGPIPDFSGLPNLKRISFYNNHITGPIPDFSGLPNLEELFLYKNQLTGQIPNFRGLSNLESLSLDYNQLSGPIPDFSTLPNLKILSLDYNQLSGPIPNFSALPKLQVLVIDGNQLTGLLPDFRALPKLHSLSVTKNKLSGPIPDFTGLLNLSSLDLDSNQFCKIPGIDYSSFNGISIDELYSDCLHILTLSKTGEGDGKITGNGIDCGSHCIKEYVENDSITLTATPDADSLFMNWSGACSGTSHCTVTMNQSQNVIATFQPKPVLLTLIPTGSGKGIISRDISGINCGSDCVYEYDKNSVMTLTAHPEADSIFEAWGDACSGNAASCVVKLSSDKTVSAQFDSCKATVEPSSKTHQFNAEKGSITVKVSNDKCPWTAISHNDDWLKITSRQDNQGNGTIDYTVTENRNTKAREGKLTIAGQTITLYQEISEKPQASFTATPLSGIAPLIVKLDASDSSAPDGKIVSYEWRTSDGQVALGKTAELILTGNNSCHPTITLTITDNHGLSAQADKTLSIENCAIVKFQGIEDAYNVGDFVRAEVKVELNIEQFKRFDLWVAILMPSGHMMFKTSFGINSFSFFAQPFKASLESQSVVHRLIDFEVPQGLGGTYTFYALIVDEGEDPNKHLDELVIQETRLAK